MGKRTSKVDAAKVATSPSDVSELDETRSVADEMEEEVDPAVEATHIRTTIEQTRADMSETIDALQVKLDPERIAAQVKEKVRETASDAVDAAKQSVRDATIGKAERMVSNVADKISDMTGISRREFRESGSSLVDYISSRPLAFSMIGVGLGMLAFSGRRESDRYSYGGDSRERDYARPYTSRSDVYGSPYEGARYGRADYGATRGPQYDYEGSGRRDSTSDSGIVESARNMAERASEAVSSAASTVKEKVGDVADYASEVPAQVRSQARVASYRAQRTIDENPMIAGIAAFAVGAILGLSLPETETENRYMGEASEDLTERIKSVAKETSETVQRVVKQTGEALKEQSQGPVDTVKRAAEEVGREIKANVGKNLNPKQNPTTPGAPVNTV